MGNLKDPTANNSVLESAELKKYTADLNNYPLPLDVALPLFDWKVLFRNNSFYGLIQDLPESCFSGSFSIKKTNRITITKDTLLMGYDLRNGDWIRDEQSPVTEIRAAADAVSGKLKNTALRVSLYHLDAVLLKKYSVHDIESMYNRLH